jgi:hypothetical protein
MKTQYIGFHFTGKNFQKYRKIGRLWRIGANNVLPGGSLDCSPSFQKEYYALEEPIFCNAKDENNFMMWPNHK